MSKFVYDIWAWAEEYGDPSQPWRHTFAGWEYVRTYKTRRKARTLGYVHGSKVSHDCCDYSRAARCMITRRIEGNEIGWQPDKRREIRPYIPMELRWWLDLDAPRAANSTFDPYGDAFADV